MAEPLTMGDLAHVLFRHGKLILAATLVGGAAALGVTQLMTPVYTATATQLVKGIPETGAGANYEAAQYAVSRAKSYPSFIDSAAVLDGVKTDLGTPATPADLAEDLSATNPVGTPLLEISATAPTADEARNKANSAARHLAQLITQIETVKGKSPITIETPVSAVSPIDKTAPRTPLIVVLGALIGFVVALVAGLISNARTQVQQLSAPAPAGEPIGLRTPVSAAAATQPQTAAEAPADRGAMDSDSTTGPVVPGTAPDVEDGETAERTGTTAEDTLNERSVELERPAAR